MSTGYCTLILSSLSLFHSLIHSFSEGHVPDSELGTDGRKWTWLSVWGEGCIAFFLRGQEALEKWHVNRESGGMFPAAKEPGRNALAWGRWAGWRPVWLR